MAGGPDFHLLVPEPCSSKLVLERTFLSRWPHSALSLVRPHWLLPPVPAKPFPATGPLHVPQPECTALDPHMHVSLSSHATCSGRYFLTFSFKLATSQL